MGEEDIRRQAPNVFSMKLLGAEVRPVTSGSRTLRDAINEAMRDWMASVETTHYIIGSVVGPHPFPRIVRDFQSVIGRETIEQSLEQLGRLPDVVVACVGGGSNAAGMFYPFVEHDRRGAASASKRAAAARSPATTPRRFVRPARRAARQLQLRDAGRRRPDVRRPFHLRRARLSRRRPRAQLLERHRPRHATPSAETTTPWPRFDALARNEGILPALESSHAVAARWNSPAASQKITRSSSASPAAAIKTPRRLRGSKARNKRGCRHTASPLCSELISRAKRNSKV